MRIRLLILFAICVGCSDTQFENPLQVYRLKDIETNPLFKESSFEYHYIINSIKDDSQKFQVKHSEHYFKSIDKKISSEINEKSFISNDRTLYISYIQSAYKPNSFNIQLADSFYKWNENILIDYDDLIDNKLYTYMNEDKEIKYQFNRDKGLVFFSLSDVFILRKL